MSRRLIRCILIASVLTAMALTTAPAQGTFKGTNGRLAFTVVTTGPQIATAKSTTGTGQKLVSKVGAYEAPEFSPDGSMIVFDDYDVEHLYRVNSDGTKQREIKRPNDVGTYPWSPSFAPSGKRVIYANNGGNSEIWVVTLDGTHNKRIGTVLGQWPRYSPDGSKITYDDGNDIWIMNANGSSPVNIDGGGISNRYADWSPNGKWLSYFRDGQIWKMRPDGTGQVAVSPVDADWGPAWAPDGKSLAYPSDSDIVIIKPDGTGAMSLAVNNTNCCIAWQPT